MAEEPLISLSEAATISGLTTRHLRHLAESGRLKAVKIARNWLTTETAVVEYLKDDELRSKDPLKNKRT